MFISKKRMLQALALSVLVMSAPSFSEASILVPRDAQEIQLTKEMENKILGVRLDERDHSSEIPNDPKFESNP